MSLEIVRAVRTIAVKLVAEFLVDLRALSACPLVVRVHIVDVDLDAGV